MKRTAFPFIRPTSALAAALFSIAVILAVAGPSGANPRSPGPAAANISEVDRTETVIRDLHSRLKIKEKQEKQWNKVSQVMRDNAKTMDALMKTRLEKVRAMNAVEDLKSYSEVTDAHAAGLKKFIVALETLYAGMSDEQKKDADTVFKGPDRQQKAKKK